MTFSQLCCTLLFYISVLWSSLATIYTFYVLQTIELVLDFNFIILWINSHNILVLTSVFSLSLPQRGDVQMLYKVKILIYFIMLFIIIFSTRLTSNYILVHLFCTHPALLQHNLCGYSTFLFSFSCQKTRGIVWQPAHSDTHFVLQCSRSPLERQLRGWGSCQLTAELLVWTPTS